MKVKSIGTMFKWFKKLKLKFFLKYYQKTHHLTERGKMILYYILNKYINGTKPDDFIEDYELSITKDENRFVESAKKCVANFSEIMPKCDEELKVMAIAHIFSAMHLFEIILISIPENNRDEWYNLIENNILRATIQKSINNKINN